MVGESGLFTPADIAYVQEAGVKAVSVSSETIASLQFHSINCELVAFICILTKLLGVF